MSELKFERYPPEATFIDVAVAYDDIEGLWIAHAIGDSYILTGDTAEQAAEAVREWMEQRISRPVKVRDS